MSSDSEKFWDKIADKYSRKSLDDEASYLKKIEVTQEHLDKDMEVVDLGCGTGTTAIIHAPYVKHIQAVDESANMLDIATRKAEHEGVTNISFIKSPVEDFIIQNMSTDVVLAHSILHLLHDKERVISDVFDGLKSGGYFITSTACLGGKNGRIIRFLMPLLRRLKLAPFVEFFTPDELVKSLVDAGFEIDYQWQPDQKKAMFIIAKKP